MLLFDQYCETWRTWRIKPMCYSLYIPLLGELLVNLYFYEFFSERFLRTRDVCAHMLFFRNICIIHKNRRFRGKCKTIYKKKVKKTIKIHLDLWVALWNWDIHLWIGRWNIHFMASGVRQRSSMWQVLLKKCKVRSEVRLTEPHLTNKNMPSIFIKSHNF